MAPSPRASSGIGRPSPPALSSTNVGRVSDSVKDRTWASLSATTPLCCGFVRGNGVLNQHVSGAPRNPSASAPEPTEQDVFRGYYQRTLICSAAPRSAYPGLPIERGPSPPEVWYAKTVVCCLSTCDSGQGALRPRSFVRRPSREFVTSRRVAGIEFPTDNSAIIMTEGSTPRIGLRGQGQRDLWTKTRVPSSAGRRALYSLTRISTAHRNTSTHDVARVSSGRLQPILLCVTSNLSGCARV
jgi:hypothetical protein